MNLSVDDKINRASKPISLLLTFKRLFLPFKKKKKQNKKQFDCKTSLFTDFAPEVRSLTFSMTRNTLFCKFSSHLFDNFLAIKFGLLRWLNTVSVSNCHSVASYVRNIEA